MGAALDVASGLQLGGPTGDGAFVLGVLLPQLLLGDAGAVLDGVDHIVVGEGQIRVAQSLGYETLRVLVNLPDTPIGGIHIAHHPPDSFSIS